LWFKNKINEEDKEEGGDCLIRNVGSSREWTIDMIKVCNM
jgi:hypothetical protein